MALYVCKRVLSDGQNISVKRLPSLSGDGLDELKMEVILVVELLHWNLIKLLGLCLEYEEKLLVYEYLPNGILNKILFGIDYFSILLKRIIKAIEQNQKNNEKDRLFIVLLHLILNSLEKKTAYSCSTSELYI